MRAGLKNENKNIEVYQKNTIMGRGKHRRYMELVAYHIYHLEERTQVIPWREVTPEMVEKYEAFSKKCFYDYIQKIQNPNKVFVQQKEK